jgi:hypothetical protein
MSPSFVDVARGLDSGSMIERIFLIVGAALYRVANCTGRDRDISVEKEKPSTPVVCNGK